MNVRFIPMKEHTFKEYFETSIQDYANEHIQAGNWTETEAMANAEEQFDLLLPNGLYTPNHVLFTIVNENGDEIGMIWVHHQDRMDEKHAFLYDITLHKAHRGKGYGRASMTALEEYAKSMKIHQIGLHVFAHNKRALALYEKMGYQTTDLVMKKKIGD